MNVKFVALAALVLLIGVGATSYLVRNHRRAKEKTIVLRKGNPKEGRLEKSEGEWKKQLTDEQFRVARKKGTERAFSGQYWNNHADGTYHCVCCGQPLFDAGTKYESGTGWPSFWQPVDADAVSLVDDSSYFMTRIEVVCSRCDAHLGHVFEDGPKPTGERYCMNSAALNFKPREEKKDAK